MSEGAREQPKRLSQMNSGIAIRDTRQSKYNTLYRLPLTGENFAFCIHFCIQTNRWRHSRQNGETIVMNTFVVSDFCVFTVKIYQKKENQIRRTVFTVNSIGYYIHSDPFRWYGYIIGMIEAHALKCLRYLVDVQR